MESVVSDKFILYRRANGIYYAEDKITHQQFSLRTRQREQARLLLTARNESARDAMVSREVGFAYLNGADPQARERDWQWVFDQILLGRSGDTLYRWTTATKDKALDLLRQLKLVDTRPEHFLLVMQRGTVSTNVYLRRIHNFALDMGWLPRVVIVRRSGRG